MGKKSSVSIAKDRLKALVVSDRVHCKPDLCDKLNQELYYTLSKYIEITPEDFNVSVTRTHIHIRITGEEQ